MRAIKVGFNRQFLFSVSNLSIKLFKDMLDSLPSDASLVGFGNDCISNIDYVFIESSKFKEVKEGDYIPTCGANFKRHPDDTVTCEGVDYSAALETPTCQHSWESHGVL